MNELRMTNGLPNLATEPSGRLCSTSRIFYSSMTPFDIRGIALTICVSLQCGRNGIATNSVGPLSHRPGRNAVAADIVRSPLLRHMAHGGMEADLARRIAGRDRLPELRGLGQGRRRHGQHR